MSHILKIYENSDETFEVMMETSDAFKNLLKIPSRKFNTSTRRWKIPNTYKEMLIKSIISLNPTIEVKNFDYEETIPKTKKIRSESSNIIKLSNENSSEFGVQFKFSQEILKIVKVYSYFKIL